MELKAIVMITSTRKLGGEAAVAGRLRYQDWHEIEDMNGTRKTQVTTHTVEFAFIPNPIRLLVLKGKTDAGKIAGKISRLIYNQKRRPDYIVPD